MLVVDTSAVVSMLVGRPPDPKLLARVVADGDLHAPYLLDVEVLHVLRRLVASGHLTADRAADARADFGDLVIMRYPHLPLADRIWALRPNLGAYQATRRGSSCTAAEHGACSRHQRHDLLGDQGDVVDVVEVEHLEVGAPGAEVGEGAQALGELLRGAREGALAQLARLAADAGGAPGELGLVGAAADRVGDREAQGRRVTAGLLAGLADPLVLHPADLGGHEGDVVLVGVRSEEHT